MAVMMLSKSSRVRSIERVIHRALLVSVMTLGGWRLGLAQAAAEYAGAVSTTGSVGAAAAPVPKDLPTPPAAQKSPSSQHLPARKEEPVEEVNRRALEGRAGKDAGRVLLRSVPSEASVWIDGKFVGKSPLLLILAPGSYRVEMKGERMASANRTVDLLPEEKREVVLELEQRYPARVRLP